MPGAAAEVRRFRASDRGLDRYVTLTTLAECPRCGGRVLRFGLRSCICCGWAGPTRLPSPDEARAAGTGTCTDGYLGLALDLWDRGYSLQAILDRIGAPDAGPRAVPGAVEA